MLPRSRPACYLPALPHPDMGGPITCCFCKQQARAGCVWVHSDQPVARSMPVVSDLYCRHATRGSFCVPFHASPSLCCSSRQKHEKTGTLVLSHSQHDDGSSHGAQQFDRTDNHLQTRGSVACNPLYMNPNESPFTMNTAQQHSRSL
jgi:hypothetical protein